MREILFRGKRTDNGKWIEGNYILQNDNEPQRSNYMKPYIKLRNFVNLYEVIPETIGQYTGLTDKNGNKIFEGDILEGHLDDAYPENATTVAVIWYKNGWCILQEECDPDLLEDIDSQYFCVIGNIHDNPSCWRCRNEIAL